MSTALPWDRFPDKPPAVTPPPAPTPPPAGETPVAPASPPAVPQVIPNLGDVAEEAFRKAMAEAGPQIKQTALDYMEASINATMKGQVVDRVPTVTAVTKEGKELVVADAKSRSLRTLFQGLAIDLFAALLAVLATLTDFNPMDKAAWATVGALVIKTLIQTVVSYVMRLRITPTIKVGDPGEKEKRAVLPVPGPVVEPKTQYVPIPFSGA